MLDEWLQTMRQGARPSITEIVAAAEQSQTRPIRPRADLPGQLRVLLTADQYYPPTLGGSAITFHRLAHALAEAGHQVAVIAPSETLHSHVEDAGRVLTVRCRAFQPFKLLNQTSRRDIRVAILPDRLVRETLNGFRPDIVHVQFPAYLGRSAARHARAAGVPVVVGCHAVPENYQFGTGGSRPVQSLARKFWDMAVGFCREADSVTAPTKTACQVLAENGVDTPIIAISNGVDLKQYRPPLDQREKDVDRAALGLPSDRTLVLYAGRFTPEKRVDLLVDAIASLPPTVHLVLCGLLSSRLDDIIVERGLRERVTALGRVSDETLPRVYRAVDIFALPSEAELQGMVLLEAAATGLPLVGANCLAIPELVHDGVNGYLHRPGDAEDLAAKIKALAAEPALRASFGEASQRIVAPHAMPAVVDQTVALYRHLIGRHHAALAG